jgi:hypothetical protein
MKTRLTFAQIERLRKLRLPADDQERIARYQLILERAASELRELAAEGRSSVSLAADAVGWKLMTMARLKAFSDTELKQLQLLEMADEVEWDPTTWNLDGRSFLSFRVKAHDGWRSDLFQGYRKRAEAQFDAERAKEFCEKARFLLGYADPKSRLPKRIKKTQDRPN